MRPCPNCGYQDTNTPPPGRPSCWDRDVGVELLREGWTLDTIGIRFGVTREAIRQGLTKYLGDEVYQEIMVAARELRAQPKPVPITRTCCVCGDALRGNWYTAPERSYCKQHGSTSLRGSIQRLIDEDRQAAHAAAVRKKFGMPEPTYDSKIWAARSRKRWLNKGSQLHTLVLEAYHKDWPLIDQLPVEVRQQIEAEVNE